MDLSLTTDFESALLNWDVDEVNNGPAPSHSDHQHLNNQDGKHKNMISSAALAAVTATSTSHDAATSLPSLPKQHEILQQLNYHQQLYQPPQHQQHTRNFNNSHPGRQTGIVGVSANNPISILDGSPTSQSSYYQTIPSSLELTTAANNGTPNLYHHHVNTTAHQNNTNLLLNGFVTALDNQSRTPTLQQSNYQVAQHDNASGSSSASSGVAVNGQTINASKSSSSSTQVEQQQQQRQRIPQHLQLDGVATPFWHLQDSSSNNRNSTNVGTTNSNAPYMERMFPPNYFLPGMVSCDPSQSLPNSSSTKVPVIDMITGGDTAASFGEYGGAKSKSGNSKSTSTTSQSNITQSAILALQQQQQNNQVNVNNASVTPWGQQVPQHQSLQQNVMQISQTNSNTTSESVRAHQTLPAQNVLNSQMSGNNAVLDASMNCGTNNMSVHHQTMYNLNGSGYGNSLPIGSVTTDTTNSINDSATTSVPVGRDTGQHHQQTSPSAPFQYITTDSNSGNSPSSPIGSNNNKNNNSGSTTTDQKRHQQNPPPRSRVTKKARKNTSRKPAKQQKRKGDTTTTPPFYLFDAPCELRTNFIQAQQLNNITVVQDNNAYHYGMAVNGFHPQLNAQANPPIQPTTKISHGSSSGSSSPVSNDRVVLLDGRHKNKIRQGNERNEREQQRAQKITELIDKLRVTMVNGGWKKNEMKSKYQTLSTCAAYVKYLIQETKKKEAAVEEARSNLAIRDRNFEEDKALQDSRSDPESVASTLTASSAYGSGDGQKGQDCVEHEEKEGCNTSILSVRAISSSSGVGSVDINNSNGSDRKNNDSLSDRLPPEEKNIKKAKTRVTIVREDHESVDRKNGIRQSEWQNISINNRCSSMSEISDSIQSSKDFSENGSDSGDCNTGSSGLTLSTKNTISECEAEDHSEASSVSSTAAVMSGIGSKEQDIPHADIMVKESLMEQKTKHVDREKTSLEVDFELNYQEVFLASNIPQLIATQTGRIAICNDFFHRATGMSEQEVQRITIFSIVQADKLSTLFELVATSLRRSNKPSSSEDCITDTSAAQWTSSNDNDTYKTVTLPCIPFPKGLKIKSGENEEEALCPLFMSVTFMSDENPRNRCIHCILTENGPTTSGKIGPITPKVLKKMFSGDGLDVCQTQPTPSVNTNNGISGGDSNNCAVEKVKDEIVE